MKNIRMNDPQLHKVLSNIESKAQDDFAMLEECGAEYFSTSDLLELRGRWKEQKRMFKKLHKANIILGASAPVWLALAAVFGIFGMVRTATFAVLMFPIAFFLFIVAAFFLRSQYRSTGYLEFVGLEIEQELKKRKSDVKQKRNL